jgi:DNA polymerase I
MSDIEGFCKVFVEKAKTCGMFAFDVEHNIKDQPEQEGFKLHGISLATFDGDQVINRYCSGSELAYATKTCITLFADENVLAVAHNGKYDIKCMSLCGLQSNQFPLLFGDTMIAANLLDDNLTPKQYGLKPLATEHLGFEMVSFEESSSAGMDSEQFAEYAARDTRATLLLWKKFAERLETEGLYKICVKLLSPASLVFADLERFGLAWDVSKARKTFRDLQKLRDDYRKKCHKFFGPINLNSPKQVAEVLFDQHNAGEEFTPSRTPTGKIQLDDEALKALSEKFPACADLLTYRKVCKQMGTYVGPLTLTAAKASDHRIHPTYWVVSQTGRTRSSNPNLQNQPARPIKFGDYTLNLRSHFNASLGSKLLIADQSQLELRLIAHISQDELLLKSFLGWECKACKAVGSSVSIVHSCPSCGVAENEKSGFWHGLDLHQQTCDLIEAVPDRATGKVCNFAIVYGCTAKTMHANFPYISEEDWWPIIDQYLETYKGVKQWHERVQVQLASRGWVREPFGRVRRIPKQFRKSKHGLNQLVNFGPQSAGVNLMLLCMNRLRTLWVEKGIWGTKVKIINMIHDELVVECSEDLVEECSKDLVAVMENHQGFLVPFRADLKVADHWGVK